MPIRKKPNGFLRHEALTKGNAMGKTAERQPLEGSGEDTTTPERINEYMRRYPSLKGWITRQLVASLHVRNIVTMDDLRRRVRRSTAESKTGGRKITAATPKRPPRSRNDEAERIRHLVVDFAARHFTPEEIDDIVNLARKREKAQELNELASLPGVSFDRLAKSLEEFCSLPEGPSRIRESEAIATRASLIRSFISERLDFIHVAKKYLSIRDLGKLASSVIGARGGAGKIGGKAAGLYLAYHILYGEHSDKRDPDLSIRMPESVHLRSELYLEFMRHNDLMEYYDQKYKPISEIEGEFPHIRELFKKGKFPKGIASRLKTVLNRFGKQPLIVRSSGLLEDASAAAFPGKYVSVFVPNQGTSKERLRDLQEAIALVYASTLGPDPIQYRRARGLLDYDERMAVLIQKVVGFKYRHWFLPAFAGVGFSFNEYRWAPTIRKEDGLVRIVMGLGTRAVQRVGEDYPRMITLTAPTMRPQVSVGEVRRYSQRFVDAINLEENRFESVKVQDLIDPAEPFPFLDRMISVFREGALSPPIGAMIDAAPSNLIITFDKLAGASDFPAKMKRILHTLEKVYGCPVGVEFAHDGMDLYLLQCRPLASRLEMERVRIPTGVPRADRLFSATRDVASASVHDVEYVVYVDPKAYDALPDFEARSEVGRAVHRVNGALEGKRFILMGPGRWGSNDLKLGVPVQYAGVHNTLILVEIAFCKGDQIPEVSFGTHFFQDLVEAGTHHLPLYPDDPGVLFQEEFFANSSSMLGLLAPEFAHLEEVVRVIHVPSVSGELHLHVDMDGEKEEALGYLK